MTAALSPHLSADELDLLLEGRSVEHATSHLETCPECRAMVSIDRQVLAAMATLPTWDPSPLFAERVLASIDREVGAVPAATGPSDRERSARRRVLIGGSVVGGLVTAGFAWAIANPGTAAGLAQPALQEVGQSIWLSVQALAANTAEQPWFSTVRDALATPARAVPALIAMAAVYATLLMSLRRLLTRPATDAGW